MWKVASINQGAFALQITLEQKTTNHFVDPKVLELSLKFLPIKVGIICPTMCTMVKLTNSHNFNSADGAKQNIIPSHLIASHLFSVSLVGRLQGCPQQAFGLLIVDVVIKFPTHSNLLTGA